MTRQVFVQCVVAGCRETAHLDAPPRREWSATQRFGEHVRTWTCFRHTGEPPLGPDRIDSTVTVTVGNVEGCGEHRFWIELHNGIARGPGFTAFAQDFPIGTRLVVTARIEMPLAPGAAGERSGGR